MHRGRILSLIVLGWILTLLTGCSTETPSPSFRPTPTPSPTPTVPHLIFAQTPVMSPLPQPSLTPTPLPTPASPRRIDKTLNILVLGSDRRNSQHKIWRTDTIMLVMVDKEAQEVAVISIPRDTYIYIPGYGYQRINVVDFFGESGVVKIKGGGPALLKKVFWSNFRVRVDHYVRIDLPGMAKIVDILGGVDVEVTCPHTVHWGDQVYHFKRGKQHLTGEELLIYMRARKESNDIDRARRQQRALMAMRDRAKELNIIPRLPAILAALHNSLQTDLSLQDILWLARMGMDIPPERVHGKVISYPLVRGTVTPRGEAVLVPDLPAIRQTIEHAFDMPALLKATEEGIACEEK